MLAVKNLSVAFQGKVILNNFSLNLKQGEIFAMLGESGSGKSTALRFIAGLDETQDGSVNLNGRKLSKQGNHTIQPDNREIGMVFQDYALFPHMTVEKNISFGINNLTKSKQKQRVEELLTMVGLEGIEQKYPHQLSGGEQQRVSLVRALAPNPKLLLLDEPFSSLDIKHRKKLVKQVREILKKTQVTSILVTHDETEANALADTIGIIKNKQLTIKQ